jgi:hypothetical protein
VWRKLMRKSSAERWLLLEATGCLVAARLALALLPFRRLVRIFDWPVSGPELSGSERERLTRQVRWAVTAAARHLPVEMVCFPRGIAAQVMLRRRRVGTTLYYGVAKLQGEGLKTHVWVQDGATGVVGHGAAEQYTVMMRYPGGGV